MNKLLLLSLLTFVLATVSFAQSESKAVNKFLQDHPDLKAYYIYQSTLRLANQSGDENFNRLIKDVDKIIVHMAEGTGEVSRDSYNAMVRELYDEGFETLVNAKYEGALINFLSKEVKSKDYFVLAVTDDDNFGLMLMDGTLDLEYLMSVQNMDFSKLTEIVLTEEENQR